MKRQIANGCAVLSILFLLVAGCKDKNKAPLKEIIRPVRYQLVTQSDTGVSKGFSGMAQSALQATMSFKVSGTVKRIAIKVGDQLKKGDEIAVLDARDYELKVAEISAGVNRIESQLRNARAVYKRSRKLYEHRNISRNDYDAAKAAYESTQSLLESTKKQLQLVRRQLQYTKLKADEKCSVAAKLVKRNENVAPGQPVAILNCGDRIEVETAVPEIYISNVKESEKVKVRFDAFPEKIFTAKVSEVGVASVSSLTAFPVTVILDKGSNGIRSGMTAEVMIPVDDSEETLYIINPKAVQHDGESTFVYKLTSLGVGDNSVYTVSKDKVLIGKLRADGIVVKEGLSDGDMIVTAGHRTLYPGIKVRLLETEGSK
ncbi:MAG: efflux RND transporter periplasmic adaptor subunit [Gammaproteobacteria bacterium]|nr:MAG: efflux RND transporter periplasmic adaptor subunit [Gammaproteobacteria bacterium]